MMQAGSDNPEISHNVKSHMIIPKMYPGFAVLSWERLGMTIGCRPRGF
jgi:hypothetical protein